MTESFETPGIHHVALVTADAQRTVDFYRDVLGLSLLEQTGSDKADAYHLYLGDAAGTPGSLLTFIEAKGLTRGAPGIGGVHHVALGVADEEALLRWKRRLTDGGTPASGPYDRRWFHSIYFRDPDGQILEIATRGPGYHLDEPIDALGQAEVVPGPENLVGQRDEGAIRALTWPEPVAEVSAGMRLDGIHHVSGITDDVRRAGAFLEETLGLRLVKRTVNQDDPSSPHWFWASYDGAIVAPHSSYTLFGWPASGRRSRGGTGQTHHVAFRAPGREAQEELRARLVHAGVGVSPITDRGHFQSVYFRAPDGMLLEIATDPQSGISPSQG